ncbi:hypothetical protein NDU88_002293 [Pleurodeles waltl]|uniref:U1-type domain-containing protein n=1 Tax=Pleurodeles waltl TaxID=8319 RepID=A0AAV7Q8A5_PLEWA|nr:hypothetical protein NDU88_002293 [Pleurodeles waltl]
MGAVVVPCPHRSGRDHGMKRPLSPALISENGSPGLTLQLTHDHGTPSTTKKEKKMQSLTLCEVCNIQLNSTAQAQIHFNGKSHQKRLKQISNGKGPGFHGDPAAGEKKITGARRDHFKQPDTTSSGRHGRNHKSAQQLGGDADRRGRPAARDTTALQPATARTRKHLRPQVSPTARRRRGSAQETGGPERDRPATSFKQQQRGRTDRETLGQHNSAAETKKAKALTRRAATNNRDPSGRNSPHR